MLLHSIPVDTLREAVARNAHIWEVISGAPSNYLVDINDASQGLSGNWPGVVAVYFCPVKPLLDEYESQQLTVKYFDTEVEVTAGNINVKILPSRG